MHGMDRSLVLYIDDLVSKDLNPQVIKRTVNSNMRLTNLDANSRYLGVLGQSCGCYELSHRLQKVLRRSFHYVSNYAAKSQTIRRSTKGMDHKIRIRRKGLER